MKKKILREVDYTRTMMMLPRPYNDINPEMGAEDGIDVAPKAIADLKGLGKIFPIGHTTLQYWITVICQALC